MYPRLSETFIVNEILAHEAAGIPLEVFSLRAPVDGRFHEALSRVQAPVSYVQSERVKAEELWKALCRARLDLPRFPDFLKTADSSTGGSAFQAILIAEAALDRGVTHLHAHFGTLATTVARLAAQLAGITYSFTMHAKDLYHESVETDDLRPKLRDASTVVTVSDYNVQYLQDRFGADASGVRRVYNGLDLQEFSYEPPEDPAPLVLGVGRLVEKKGFADLIESFAVLARTRPELRCEIIGDGALRPSLAEQIRSRGLDDRVRLLGALPRHDVVDRLRRAAVLAAPCIIAEDGNRDGMPTVLLEAMALGVPCISTTVTGIPELVRHEETGLLHEPGDHRALADAIDRVTRDRALAHTLVRNARRLIETEFEVHTNTAQLREIFRAAGRRDALAAGLGVG
jgi:glycosyltransferase involved in cell wall biosynthesis